MDEIFSVEFPHDDSPFLNPLEEVKITRSGVPHWFQDGKLQFITFRLGDSLSSEDREYIMAKISLFKSLHPEPWNNETRKKYYSYFPKYIEGFLDQGYGSCLLKRRECREILENALRWKDNDYYKIHNYVIMPNHVHLLIEFDSEHEPIIRSIRRFSATQMNKLVGRKGELWNKIIWDTLIRNESHYNACVDYINRNPRYLNNEDYSLYDYRKG